MAVGISAGVGALTSAVPALHAYTLPLCLGILALITAVNLRGTKESGLALALPTYAFIASLAFVLGYGVWRAWSGDGPPEPVVAPPGHPAAEAEAVTLWLLLRAFAAGCTAMTGVEGVSNGVNAFREPAVKHARRTLTAIVVVLGLLLLGIAYLANGYGVAAMDQREEGYQSVLSQVVGAAWGRGWLYYVTIGSVLAVLCLSANTSFVAFPRVCRQVAADGYLPRAFALPGRRLVYTAGLLFLAGGAGALLLAFGGITDRLIPLFAVGAFLSFTLSQAGMVVHWRREGRGRADRLRLAVNGLGAAATGTALAIILAAKFTEGAWLIIVVVPLALLLLKLVRRYYRAMEGHALRGAARCLSLDGQAPPVVVVPLERWDGTASRAVRTALRLSPDVVALHLQDLAGPDAEAEQGRSRERLREEWARCVEEPSRAAGLAAPRLLIESSPYRSLFAPLERTIEAERRECPGRPVVVVLSEFVGGHWWEALLHTHRTKRLRRQLLRNGGPELSVLVVPWRLAPARTEMALAEEEPQPA